MRRVKIVQITAAGRDQGKKFFLKEMPSKVAERWGDRCFLALSAGHTNLPPNLRTAALVGRNMRDVATLARLVGNVSFSDLEPLLDQLMGCIRFLPDAADSKYRDPADAQLFTIDLIDSGSDSDHIEETATRYLLRSEVIALHSGWNLPAAIFNIIASGSSIESTASDPPPKKR